MSDEIPADIERNLNLLRLQQDIDADEVAVMEVIQRAVQEDIYTNPPGSQLPGSAVLMALRELDQDILRKVLWPEQFDGSGECIHDYDHEAGKDGRCIWCDQPIATVTSTEDGDRD
jgi:hypothetical protein